MFTSSVNLRLGLHKLPLGVELLQHAEHLGVVRALRLLRLLVFLLVPAAVALFREFGVVLFVVIGGVGGASKI